MPRPQLAPTLIAPPVAERREVMTLAEAADRWAVSYETFRRWVAKGILAHHSGPYGTIRVYRRDVEGLFRRVQP